MFGRSLGSTTGTGRMKLGRMVISRIGSRTLPGTGSSNNCNAINSGENAAAAASKGRADEKQRYVWCGRMMHQSHGTYSNLPRDRCKTFFLPPASPGRGEKRKRLSLFALAQSLDACKSAAKHPSSLSSRLVRVNITLLFPQSNRLFYKLRYYCPLSPVI